MALECSDQTPGICPKFPLPLESGEKSTKKLPLRDKITKKKAPRPCEEKQPQPPSTLSTYLSSYDIVWVGLSGSLSTFPLLHLLWKSSQRWCTLQHVSYKYLSVIGAAPTPFCSALVYCYYLAKTPAPLSSITIIPKS